VLVVAAMPTVRVGTVCAVGAVGAMPRVNVVLITVTVAVMLLGCGRGGMVGVMVLHIDPLLTISLYPLGVCVQGAVAGAGTEQR
ncbi:hypothetical protein, partial [Micromonospora sp. CPCC 206061]|uniref:hypothetical protein n=1 Tax=Micromonospora sp. CPCC 206061 TaxID=3122410 RepID=UPI002FF3F32A